MLSTRPFRFMRFTTPPPYSMALRLCPQRRLRSSRVVAELWRAEPQPRSMNSRDALTSATKTCMPRKQSRPLRPRGLAIMCNGGCLRAAGRSMVHGLSKPGTRLGLAGSYHCAPVSNVFCIRGCNTTYRHYGAPAPSSQVLATCGRWIVVTAHIYRNWYN